LAIRIPTGPRFNPRPLPVDDLAGHLATDMTTNRYRYQAVLTMHGSASEVTDHGSGTAHEDTGLARTLMDESCFTHHIG